MSQRVTLSEDDIRMLLQALRIGAEDGSLFSDDETEFAEEEPRYQHLVTRLRSKLPPVRAEGTPHDSE